MEEDLTYEQALREAKERFGTAAVKTPNGEQEISEHLEASAGDKRQVSVTEYNYEREDGREVHLVIQGMDDEGYAITAGEPLATIIPHEGYRESEEDDSEWEDNVV